MWPTQLCARGGTFGCQRGLFWDRGALSGPECAHLASDESFPCPEVHCLAHGPFLNQMAVSCQRPSSSPNPLPTPRGPFRYKAVLSSPHRRAPSVSKQAHFVTECPIPERLPCQVRDSLARPVRALTLILPLCYRLAASLGASVCILRMCDRAAPLRKLPMQEEDPVKYEWYIAPYWLRLWL